MGNGDTAVPSSAMRDILDILRVIVRELLGFQVLGHYGKHLKERPRRILQGQKVLGKYIDLTKLYLRLVPDKTQWNVHNVENAFWTFFLGNVYGKDIINRVFGTLFKAKCEFVVKPSSHKLNAAFFTRLANDNLKVDGDDNDPAVVERRAKKAAELKQVLKDTLQACLNNPEVVFKGWIKKAEWHDVLWLYDAPQRDGKPDWGKIRNDQKIRKEYPWNQLDKLINDFENRYEKQLSSDDDEQENETEATPKRKNVGSGSGATPKKKAKKAAAAAVPKKMTNAQLWAELNALGLGQTLKKNAKKDELVAALNEATAPAAGVSAAAAAAAFMVKKPTPDPEAEEAHDDDDDEDDAIPADPADDNDAAAANDANNDVADDAAADDAADGAALLPPAPKILDGASAFVMAARALAAGNVVELQQHLKVYNGIISSRVESGDLVGKIASTAVSIDTMDQQLEVVQQFDDELAALLLGEDDVLHPNNINPNLDDVPLPYMIDN